MARLDDGPSSSSVGAGMTSRAVALAAWPLAVLLVLTGLLQVLRASLSLPSTDPTRGQDFRDAVYYPVKELATGGDPYVPQNMFEHWHTGQEFDLYSPHHLLLHLPLLLLDVDQAWIAYVIVGVLAIAAGGVVTSRLIPTSRPWLWATVLAGVALLSLPARLMIYFGNVNTLVWLGSAAALVCAERSRASWPGAIGLVLAFIKPQYAIPLSVLLAARGAWPTVLRGVGISAVLAAPVTFVLAEREGGVGELLHVFSANLAYAQTTSYGGRASSDRVDLGAQLARFTGFSPDGIEFVLAAGMLLVVGFLVRSRRGEHPEDLLLITATVMTTLVHTAIELLLPMVGIAAVIVTAVVRRRISIAPALATLLLAVPLPLGTWVQHLVGGAAAMVQIQRVALLGGLILALVARADVASRFAVSWRVHPREPHQLRLEP
jgi:hypothetical protein